MRDTTFLRERLPTPIGGLVILTDEQDRLRAVDWEDHTERMRRLLRLHYGAGCAAVLDRGSHSAAWQSLRARP
jgi:methylated-DNA-[protein]-cysteine S-methyltransferase